MQHEKIQQDNMLLLEFKDTNWLHAQWNVCESNIQVFIESFKQDKLKNYSWALRILPYAANGRALNHTYHLITLKDGYKYIYVSREPGAADCIHHYTGELGLLSTSLHFFSLIYSNAAILPSGDFIIPSGITQSFYYIRNSSSEVYYDYA